MAQDILTKLRRLNRALAILIGIGLLLCAAFVLSDIVLRQIGASFGGTDEISGYAMAIAAAWGMSFTLLELGHVRIDLLRSRVATRGRVLFDLFSMLVLTVTVIDHRGEMLAGPVEIHCQQFHGEHGAGNAAVAGPGALVRGLGLVRADVLAHHHGSACPVPARQVR